MFRALLLSTILASFLTSSSTSNQSKSTGPIIGILTVPSDYAPEYPPTNYSYIPSSYVKHYWAAGARIVPIQYDLPESKLKWYFERVNGLVFPGGGIVFTSHGEPSHWAMSGEYLVGLALEANRLGDYFPIMGTCLGYQLLTSIMAQNWSLMVHVQLGSNISKNVFLTEEGAGSKMYQDMSKNMINIMETQKVSFFHHNNTPDPEAWTQNTNLRETMEVLTWTSDGGNRTYPASVGGITLPFWGTQFHPEQISYEWWVEEGIPHNHDAVLYEQYFSEFFVNQTKLSKHSFETEELERQYDIQNLNAQHLPGPFETVYFFENLESARWDPDIESVSEYELMEDDTVHEMNWDTFLS